MDAIRDFFSGTAGKVTAVILILFGIGTVYYSIKSNLGQSDAAAMSADRMFVCSETLKVFKHEVELGETIPVMSPYSGKLTGYPGEPCYWTADGGTKKDPTWVLVNEWIHQAGPTFCPDCGRLVVPHNPVPRAGLSAPPTKAEWMARHGQADIR